MPLAVTKHFGCVVVRQAAAESHLHNPLVTSHLLVAPLVAVATAGRHEPALHYKFEINNEDVTVNNIFSLFHANICGKGKSSTYITCSI